MDGGLVDTAAQIDVPDDRRIYGVTVGQVIKNCDGSRLGRVQVRLSWLPDYEPWARLAILDRRAYFIPQVGDEVLVAFNQGDVREPYIVGQLWNSANKPPLQGPDDPVNKRIIRTPQGHEIAFDDRDRTITITGADKHKISISPSAVTITMAESTATLTLEKSGAITLQSKTSIKLDAPSIKITGQNLDIGGSSSVRIDGGSYCSIAAGNIYIG